MKEQLFRFSIGFILVVSILFSACKKNEPMQTVKSAMTMVVDKNSELIQKQSKTIKFDSGYAYVSKVEIRGEMEDYDHNREHIENNEHNSVITDLAVVNVYGLINLANGNYEVPITFDLY